LDSDKLSACELFCNIIALKDGAFKAKHVA